MHGREGIFYTNLRKHGILTIYFLTSIVDCDSHELWWFQRFLRDPKHMWMFQRNHLAGMLDTLKSASLFGKR
jgi:hypothetical protein